VVVPVCSCIVKQCCVFVVVPVCLCIVKQCCAFVVVPVCLCIVKQCCVFVVMPVWLCIVKQCCVLVVVPVCLCIVKQCHTCGCVKYGILRLIMNVGKAMFHSSIFIKVLCEQNQKPDNTHTIHLTIQTLFTPVTATCEFSYIIQAVFLNYS
jgi:hypothetical protein